MDLDLLNRKFQYSCTSVPIKERNQAYWQSLNQKKMSETQPEVSVLARGTSR